MTEDKRDPLFERALANAMLRIEPQVKLSRCQMQEILSQCVLDSGVDPRNERSRQDLEEDVMNAVCHFGILEEYLEDPEITEIMVNGTSGIFLEKRGVLFDSKRRFRRVEQLEELIHRIMAGCNRTINEYSPICDARLANGDRVHAVLGTIALDGPYLNIRKFPQLQLTMKDLMNRGCFEEELAEAFLEMVREGNNILISGGTGSGKTTLLNALAAHIPEEERVISIEDSLELQLHGIANLVRLEKKVGNAEGHKGVGIRDLLRAALRMRANRILIGEVRGIEVVDMIQAMNTGHRGCMTTAHGNNALDILMRLETMVLMDMNIPLLAIRRQIASAFQVIIHMMRLPDGSRRVKEVLILRGMENENYDVEWIFGGETRWE